MQAQVKRYAIRKPAAAFLVGAAVALLGGLIGLGGAEFRLPLLIAIFELFPQRAVRVNLLISFGTLVASAASRLSFVTTTNVSHHGWEIVGMIGGGMLAAWLGAGYVKHLPKDRLLPLIGFSLLGISALLVVETVYAGSTALHLPADGVVRASVAVLAGLLVGTVSSMLGVAGGELIIPILIFVFGSDIRTAGTASVLISLPIVITGLTRHIISGHFRSRSLLTYLVLPMTVGSLLGAMAGGYLAALVPTDTLRLVLAFILAVSSIKLMQKHSGH